MKKLIDIKQLSEMLQVKVSTIYGWVHERYIPHRKIGRLVRFNEKEIDEWLDSTKVKGRRQRVSEINLK